MDKQIDLPLGDTCLADSSAYDRHYTVLGGFCLGLGLPEWADHYLPGPGSGAGYKASEYLLPLVLMLIGGGRSLEDIRLIKDNRYLRHILKLDHIPSPDAIGDWLRRTSQRGGLEGLDRINRRLLKRGLVFHDEDTTTIDICAMRIAAEKITAKKMPDGHRGYRPLVGFLKEQSLVVGDAFHEGDVTLSASLAPFITHCYRQLPEACPLNVMRAAGPAPWPAAQYPSDFMTDVIMGIDADDAILQRIHSLPESEWHFYRAGRLAAFNFDAANTDAPNRVIVWRPPYQADLFGESVDTEHNAIIVTSASDSAETIMDQYRDHLATGDASIKVLEDSFALERMPCGQTDANAVFFRIGTLAHNIYQLYRHRVAVPSCESVQDAAG